jgi:sensor domain CHASE-containing protein
MRKLPIVLAAAAVLTALFAGSFYFHQRSAEQARSRCALIAQEKADLFVSSVNFVIKRAEKLKSKIELYQGQTAFAQEDMKALCEAAESTTGISPKAVAIAPRGVISEVYPSAGNEFLLGFNYLDKKKRENERAKEIYMQGDTHLTNPYSPKLGAHRMEIRVPVILLKNGERKLWGLVTAALDMENVFQAVKLDSLGDQGLIYRLSRIEDDGTSRVLRSNGAPGKHAVHIYFSTKNLEWELAASPKGE